MIRTLAMLAFFSALSAVGCAGTAEATGDSSADATRAEGHRAATQACNDAVDATLARRAPIEEQVQAEVDYRACLVRANDDAIGPLVSILKAHGSAAADRLERTVLRLRTADATLCAELDKARDDARSDAGRLASAACPASHERFLASIIEGMVKLDGNPLALLPPWPEHHDDCYADHPPISAASKTALEACIRRDTDFVIGELGEAIHENDPSTTAATATAGMATVIDQALEAGAALCDDLGGAGDGDANLCGVRVAEHIYVDARPAQ